MFRVHGAKLTFEQKVYTGDEPTSLTISRKRLYVLDGSVASNSIRGFTRGNVGRLTALKGSVQPLSSPIAVPGDIEFSPDTCWIVVTKNGHYASTANFGSGTISSYRVADDGKVTLRQGATATLPTGSQRSTWPRPTTAATCTCCFAVPVRSRSSRSLTVARWCRSAPTRAASRLPTAPPAWRSTEGFRA